MSQSFNKIRVLIADDSSLVRRLIQRVLTSDETIEVCGMAKDGVDAVEKIVALKPDVVTLDIEMPRMDGLQALQLLHDKKIRVPVIMFSTLTEHGGRATVKALTLGASDYLLKPSNNGSGIDATLDKLRRRLIPKIKKLHTATRRSRAAAAAGRRTMDPASSNRAGYSRPLSARRSRPNPVTTRGTPNLCVIGSSTGGPAALHRVISSLPQRYPLPILVVQHMPKMFTRLLAERLNTVSKLRVREAEAGMAAVAGTVLIAPGGYHMVVKRQGTQFVVDLTTEEPVNHCRPAVDVLFHSAAQIPGANPLVAVLTGMGRDGAKGAGEIRRAGGYVIAQDEDSSVIWGMPGTTVKEGHADTVVALDEIAATLVRRASHRMTRAASAPAGRFAQRGSR